MAHVGILNEDGTLNVYSVTVEGETIRGKKTETFLFTLEVNKSDAHGKARAMWQALHDKDRVVMDIDSKLVEVEVVGRDA